MSFCSPCRGPCRPRPRPPWVGGRQEKWDGRTQKHRKMGIRPRSKSACYAISWCESSVVSIDMDKKASGRAAQLCKGTRDSTASPVAGPGSNVTNCATVVTASSSNCDGIWHAQGWALASLLHAVLGKVLSGTMGCVGKCARVSVCGGVSQLCRIDIQKQRLCFFTGSHYAYCISPCSTGPV